jgi:glyoxylase-like metal-dependent hydrolase (beta-lactamase superfamily II)
VDTVPDVAGLVEVDTSEEGQLVVWDGWAWQRRELAKVLPLEVPWPDEAEIGAVLLRHGLGGAKSAAAIDVPARITAGVYLVGSWPAHTYLIDCGPDGLALVDPGLAANFVTITQNVDRLGLQSNAIRWVLNTHAHFDHSMADGLFRDRGAEICIGEADSSAVQDGTDLTANYLMPEVLSDYPKTKVDRRLVDGQDLKLGNKSLRVIATPGHTPGSTCFFLESEGKTVLFSGDTVLHDCRLGWSGISGDDRAYLRSLQKLAAYGPLDDEPMRWDVMLPGHGTIILSEAWLDVDKAVRAVRDVLRNDLPIPPLPFSEAAYRKSMYGRARCPRT